MNIHILKLDPGQKIARPFAQAVSVDEATELLQGWDKYNHGSTSKLLRVAANLDTEKTCFEKNGVKFYVFTGR